MQNTKEITDSKANHKRISGMLVSALNMEDEIAHSVYNEYLDRKNWPDELKDDAFENIRINLTILLEDTKKHRAIIKHLQSKFENEDNE